MPSRIAALSSRRLLLARTGALGAAGAAFAAGAANKMFAERPAEWRL